MAYLPGFDFDVFVSYAHADDELLNNVNWVTQFERELKVKLRMVVGKPVEVWFDHQQVDPAHVIDAHIPDQVRRSGILVSVVSPSYVESDWCTRELEAFIDSAKNKGGVAIGNKLRIIKVVKTPVAPPAPEIREPLKGLKGCEFFRLDQHDRPRELWLGDPNVAAEYGLKVGDVAEEIRKLFLLIKKGVDEPAAPRRTVYLAEATADLAREHDWLRRELEARGYAVVPDRALPVEAGELEATVKEFLKSAELSVHLIGARYGFVPDGAEHSIVEIQNQLASECDTAGFSRILWIPPGLQPLQEHQTAFINKIRSQPGGAARFDLLETSREELKSFVLDRMDRKKSPEPAAPQPSSAAGTRIYLIRDPRDESDVEPLIRYLDEQGFVVIHPLGAGEPEQVREDHKENLLLCDAVLIWWGHADEFWLRQKMRDLIKAPGMGRTTPFRATAVCIAGPPAPEKDKFICSAREARVLRFADGLKPEPLAPVFESLRKTP
jgi:hypothetical protein